MRIWHEELIPKLCRQHLLAVWREGLGCWAILTEDKKGYRNHPAVKEFEHYHCGLRQRLELIREEMLKRGYNPKEIPEPPDSYYWMIGEFKACPCPLYPRQWQTLEEQIKVLKAKGCNCELN